jgi:hypothetical protein
MRLPRGVGALVGQMQRLSQQSLNHPQFAVICWWISEGFPACLVRSFVKPATPACLGCAIHLLMFDRLPGYLNFPFIRSLVCSLHQTCCGIVPSRIEKEALRCIDVTIRWCWNS